MPTFGAKVGLDFRERVKRIRLVRRWDQPELAKRAGTSTTAISQIERGRVAPTTDQVEGIASALGYGVEFLTNDMQLLATTRPWLRAYADARKREADARTAETTLAAEYIRRLDLPLLPDLLPSFNGDLEDEDGIDDVALEVRQLAGIDGEDVVSNAVRAAERLGCVVLPLESELGRHVGMSVRADGIPILCVAKNDVPGDRQRFTVAHELGHLVLHRQAAPPRDAAEAARMERQAHRFASAFLAPGDALIDTLNDFGGKVTLQSLAKVKAVWGISIKGLVGRYRSLQIIDEDHARSLYKQISARKWTKQEPVHVPTEAAQWFEKSLVRKAGAIDLRAAAVTAAKAIGGNAGDLQHFADWSDGVGADVVHLSDRRRKSDA